MPREGPFWDAVEGRTPLPAAAATLGWELLDEDGVVVAVATATVRIRCGMLREPAAED